MKLPNVTPQYLKISRFIKEKYLTSLENYVIKNLYDVESLHKRLINIRMNLYFNNHFDVMPHYRGEQNYGWDILPGIFRPPFSTEIDLNKARRIEENGVNIFKKIMIEKFGKNQIFKHSVKPNGEIWDLLFQAQHAGVRTNLIDWSTSSILSSFFVCEPSEKYENADGQLWSLLVPSDFILNETSDYNELCYPQLNPYDLNKSFLCNVPIYIYDINQKTYQFRLFRQHGRLFTSSNADLEVPLNRKEFWGNMMFRVRVPAGIKSTILGELKKAGVDRQSMMINESDEANKMIDKINIEMKNCI